MKLNLMARKVMFRIKYITNEIVQITNDDVRMTKMALIYVVL